MKPHVTLWKKICLQLHSFTENSTLEIWMISETKLLCETSR